MPGGNGDPHLSGFDNRNIPFVAEPYTMYLLFDQGSWRVTALATPGPAGGGTVFGCLWFVVNGVTIQIDTDGHVRISDANYDVNVHALGCSLPLHLAPLVNPDDPMNPIAYTNFEFGTFPGTRTGESGAIVDGDGGGKTATDYVVTSPYPPPPP